MKKIKLQHIVFTVILNILIISCNKSVNKLPQIDNAELKTLTKAYTLYSEKNWSQALETIDAFLKKYPKYFTASLLQCKILYFSGNEELALKTLEDLTKKFPDYYEAHFWLAKFYYTSQEIEKSKDILNYLMQINSHDHNTIYLSSMIDISEDKLDVALDKLYTAGIVREEIALIYYQMSNIFLDIGAIDKAEEQLKKGIILVEEDDLLYQKINLNLEAINIKRKNNYE